MCVFSCVHQFPAGLVLFWGIYLPSAPCQPKSGALKLANHTYKTAQRKHSNVLHTRLNLNLNSKISPKNQKGRKKGQQKCWYHTRIHRQNIYTKKTTHNTKYGTRRLVHSLKRCLVLVRTSGTNILPGRWYTRKIV